MTISLSPEIMASLRAQAQSLNVTPEALAQSVLRDYLVYSEVTSTLQTASPNDETWEQRLVKNAIDCGMSFPNEAFSSEGLYD